MHYYVSVLAAPMLIVYHLFTKNNLIISISHHLEISKENCISFIHLTAFRHFQSSQSKEEGKDQESIQSNTTPDPGHHMGERQKHKKTSHKRVPRGQPFSSR